MRPCRLAPHLPLDLRRIDLLVGHGGDGLVVHQEVAGGRRELLLELTMGSRVLVLLTLLLVDGELNKSDYYF